MSSAICFNLARSKILSSGNWLSPLERISAWTPFADVVDQDQTAQNVQSDL